MEYFDVSYYILEKYANIENKHILKRNNCFYLKEWFDESGDLIENVYFHDIKCIKLLMEECNCIKKKVKNEYKNKKNKW
jgi:hypothetical protein